MSEAEQVIDLGDWTPEGIERLRALVSVKDPKWYRPVIWILHRIPGTIDLRRKLDNYQTARAVRIYREAPMTGKRGERS